MSIDRKVRIMISAMVVFVFLTIVFCWGSTGVNTVNRNNKAVIEQVRGG